MDENSRVEIEAAVLRRLAHHFRERTDVQNIDLMNLAGFCRNCLAKWYRAAAAERDIDMSYDEAREIVYGMPYGEFKARHQTETSPQTVNDYKDSIARYGEAGERWFSKPM